MGSRQIITLPGAPPIEYWAPSAAELDMQMAFPQEIATTKEQFDSVLSELIDLENDGGESYIIVASNRVKRIHELSPLPENKRRYIFYKTVIQRNLPFGHSIYKRHSYLSRPQISSIAYIGEADVQSMERNVCRLTPLELPDFKTIESRLEELENEWKKSTAAKQITQILNPREEFEEFVNYRDKSLKPITKVVGIGLGNPGENLLRGQSGIPEKSYFKFRILVHIAQELGKAQGKQDIKIFVQDPDCKPLTASVAKYLSNTHNCDMKVVRDPLGYNEMDDQTVLFHNEQYPTVTYNVAAIALEAAGENGLAGLLGPRIDAEVDHQKQLTGMVIGDTTMHNLGKLVTTKTYEWVKSCKEIPVKRDEDCDWFGLEPSFYVPRPKEGHS